MVKSTIFATFTTSQEKFRNAYNVAFHCPHGCECKFIEDEFNRLTKARAEAVGKIEALDAEIDVHAGEIAAFEEGACDFSVIAAKYDAIWAEDLQDHED